MKLKTNDDYSSVICETCNNELRHISVFRKELINKQASLYGFVEGCCYPDDGKYFEQEEQLEVPVPSIKRENIEIKIEPAQETEEYYNSMLSMEYLDTAQEDAYFDEDQQRNEEFALTHQKPTVLKKQYKR